MAASTSLILAADGRLRSLPPKKRVSKQRRTRLTTWPDMDAHCSSPGDLIPIRLQVLRELAQSLETSQLALVRNDSEKIARGAAHQAELCRRWSLLETQLRRPAPPVPIANAAPGGSSSLDIEREFNILTTRIRHLTRVHCSLLRHLQRSLAILGHRVEARANTYTHEVTPMRSEPRPQAGD